MNLRRSRGLVTAKMKDEAFAKWWMMLTSGIGCRGIDTSHVGHVVLFDFPRDPSEYIRRVGRTARGAAGTGQSSILVLGRQVCSLSKNK